MTSSRCAAADSRRPWRRHPLRQNHPPVETRARAPTPAPRARDHGGAAQEFAEADWEANDEDAEDEKLWEDDWDDDDADDEFVVQLREELSKTAGGSS